MLLLEISSLVSNAYWLYQHGVINVICWVSNLLLFLVKETVFQKAREKDVKEILPINQMAGNSKIVSLVPVSKNKSFD